MPGFKYSVCGPFTKNKEEYKNLKKLRILDIFLKTKQIKCTFNTKWLMVILRICVEEQPLIKYYMIKPLILQKSQNGYQRGLTSIVYAYRKKSPCVAVTCAWSEILAM